MNVAKLNTIVNIITGNKIIDRGRVTFKPEKVLSSYMTLSVSIWKRNFK